MNQKEDNTMEALAYIFGYGKQWSKIKQKERQIQDDNYIKEQAEKVFGKK